MVSFRLEELGWKAFQDLCGTIGREVLGKTLNVFSSGQDGGRDGAFEGNWKPTVGSDLTGPSVIQCKHFSDPSTSLTLSVVQDELAKIDKLVQGGRCTNYILMSNAKLPAPNEIAIREAIQNKGVEQCLIYGSEWIEKTIIENQKLRMMVPRIYGLGDLSQIIDDRAYRQASALLKFLQYEIDTFVPTESYRKAAKCLDEHGLVLLLGEPAAGKSVIASTLALAATDQWQCLTIRVDNAADFTKHWNPDEPKQFFWIDDAFGTTQYQEELVNNWNSVLPKMRAAVDLGAKIVLTSRNYIWNSAQMHLKLTSWPELKIDQVLVDVEKLVGAEREAILYNHMKLGKQPQTFKSEIKPLLPLAAAHPRFLPELARRLGDPSFTNALKISADGINAFFESPEGFLVDCVRNLDKASKAALTLLVMSLGNLPSPLNADENQLEAISLLGTTEALVKDALVAMEGSFLKTAYSSTGERTLIARHPTIVEAVTTLMKSDTERFEIYLKMAKLERLFIEISCGMELERSVQIPISLFKVVIGRLSEIDFSGRKELPRLFVYFLNYRCSDAFLLMFVEAFPEIVNCLLSPSGYLSDSREISLLDKLNDLNLVSEEQLDTLAEYAKWAAITIPDASAVSSDWVRDLLGSDRAAMIHDFVREELPSRIREVCSEWVYNYDPEVSITNYLEPLRDALETFGLNDLERYVGDAEDELEHAEAEQADRLEDMDDDTWNNARVSESSTSRDIFDDVDA